MRHDGVVTVLCQLSIVNLNELSTVNCPLSTEFSGGYYEKVTPVPIPNTAVKLLSADDTWTATSRESRSPPDLYSSIAQLVEHAAVNRRVVGSSPTRGATFFLAALAEREIMRRGAWKRDPRP